MTFRPSFQVEEKVRISQDHSPVCLVKGNDSYCNTRSYFIYSRERLGVVNRCSGRGGCV